MTSTSRSEDAADEFGFGRGGGVTSSSLLLPILEPQTRLGFGKEGAEQHDRREATRGVVGLGQREDPQEKAFKAGLLAPPGRSCIAHPSLNGGSAAAWPLQHCHARVSGKHSLRRFSASSHGKSGALRPRCGKENSNEDTRAPSRAPSITPTKMCAKKRSSQKAQESKWSPPHKLPSHPPFRKNPRDIDASTNPKRAHTHHRTPHSNKLTHASRRLKS